jgi:hypothetical protein
VLTYRDLLPRYLAHAAEQLGCEVVGEPVYGWHDRTLGVGVRTGGGDGWLRIASAAADWASEPDWTGNATADGPAFARIPKPRILRSLEWVDGHRIARADLMTYVAAPVVADGLVLEHPIALADAWWRDLRTGIAPLRDVTRTDRVTVNDHTLRHGLPTLFGVTVDLDRLEWSVAHGDLHFGNLTAPDLCILDWEHWGWAPAGYDAAVLACSAVLQPAVTARVRTTFADQLGGYTGAVAQLAAAAKYLNLVELGDHPVIAAPIRRHVETIIEQHLL